MKTRITLSALAVTVALFQVGHGNERDRKTTDLEKQPAREQSGETTITVGNVVEYVGCGWPEVTTAVLARNEHPACPEGRIFFASGSAVLSTKLNGELVNPSVPVWKATFNETYPPYPILDNHIVKLKGGDLLHTELGITWNESLPEKPNWWDLTNVWPLKNQKHPGGRAMCWMWRSSDCGKTWIQLPGLDAALVPVPQGSPAHMYGTPILKRIDPNKKDLTEAECNSDPANCTKKTSGGGWDGHFVYADPFTGNVFLATKCSYGDGQWNSVHKLTFVFVSTDNGETWKIAGKLPGRHEFRAPMTSSASGAVAFAFSSDDGLKLATLTPPFNGVDLTSGISVAKLPDGGKKFDIYNVWSTKSLACDSKYPSFTLSTPYWENGSVLTHRLYGVSTGTGYVSEINAPIKAPSGGDTLFGTLIEGPPGSSLTLFYWVERRSTVRWPLPGRIGHEFGVKFQAFWGGVPMLDEPGDLSVRNGQPYIWPYKGGGSPGDYMVGASYKGLARHGTATPYNFIATWSEEGCLRFNTVQIKLPYSRKPKYELEETRPPKIILPGDVKPIDLFPGEHIDEASAGAN